MADDEALPDWRVREARQRWEEWRQFELAHYGEEEFARRIEGKKAVPGVLCQRVTPLAEEALRRGFPYFGCELDIGKARAIVLQFADGEGAYYQRSIRIERLMKERLNIPQLPDYYDIKAAVYLHMRKLEGIRMMGRHMRARKVRIQDLPGSNKLSL